MLAFRPDKFSRSFDSFRETPPTILLEYDSSLEGMGIRLSQIVYDVGGMVSGYTPLGLDAYKFDFDLGGDSSYQNTCEFLAVVVAFLTLGALGWRNITLSVVGDSMTSNHWCAAERYKGRSSHRAAFIFTLIATHFNFWVSETEWICSSENEDMDLLSRGSKRPEEMVRVNEQVLNLRELKGVQDLVNSCNPLLPELDWTGTVELWKTVQAWLV
jgi:hypothetical protein